MTTKTASFKGLIERAAAGCGYVMIPEWRRQSFPLATRLRQLFVHHRIETVIDVGANEGQYQDFLRTRVGFDGRIESFEPTPARGADCASGQTGGFEQ